MFEIRVLNDGLINIILNKKGLVQGKLETRSSRASRLGGRTSIAWKTSPIEKNEMSFLNWHRARLSVHSLSNGVLSLFKVVSSLLLASGQLLLLEWSQAAAVASCFLLSQVPRSELSFKRGFGSITALLT